MKEENDISIPYRFLVEAVYVSAITNAIILAILLLIGSPAWHIPIWMLLGQWLHTWTAKRDYIRLLRKRQQDSP